MYAVVVIALLFVLPLVSTAIEIVLGATDIVGVAGKWLVVWAVGARLFLAGVRQVTQPGYTAETFFASPIPARTASCARWASAIFPSARSAY